MAIQIDLWRDVVMYSIGFAVFVVVGIGIALQMLVNGIVASNYQEAGIGGLGFFLTLVAFGFIIFSISERGPNLDEI